MAKLAEGTVFGGDYRVVRPLSTGGMGAVYVVEQLSTGRRRALKVLLPSLVRDPRSLERFLSEARIGARIESDNVVEVLAAGVDEASGLPWLTMELLEGDVLTAVLKRHAQIPPSGVLEIGAQLCDALGRAHTVGIVHADLKPDNVFIAHARRRGTPFTVKVLDFGIARLVSEETQVARVTTPMGSPLWMAPEQTSRGAEITPGTDVWALGLLVFRMLTGRSFWRGANVPRDELNLAAIVMEIVVYDLPSASARAEELGVARYLPHGFDAWFGRCVVRDVALRFANATQAYVALEPLLRPAAAAPVLTPLPPAPTTATAPVLAATQPAAASFGWTGAVTPAPTVSPVPLAVPPSPPASGGAFAPGARVAASVGGGAFEPATVVEANAAIGLLRVRFDHGAESWVSMTNVRAGR